MNGDSGGVATHFHHHLTTGLVGLAPVVFVLPSSWEVANQLVGTVVAASVAGHSWIGLNYVVTDYVPKVNKALLGPARVINAAVGLVTFVGLTAIAFNHKRNGGGIPGTISALWKNTKPKLQQQT